MSDRIEYFMRITAIHDEAVRRLVDNKDISLDELASFFEDIGRFYIDVSEDIRGKATPGNEPEISPMVRQSASPSSPTACLAEDLAG